VKPRVIKKENQEKLVFFGEDFVALAGSTPCPCSDEDYECDHCFYRPELDSPCTLECSIDGIPEPAPGICDTYHPYYNVSAGYRLVDNSKCVSSSPDAVPKPQGLVPCPITNGGSGPSSNSSSVVWILVTLFVLVLIASVGAGVYILYKRNAAVRDFITYTLGYSPAAATDSSYSTVSTADALSMAEK